MTTAALIARMAGCGEKKREISSSSASSSSLRSLSSPSTYSPSTYCYFSLFCHEGEGGGKKSTRGCHCPAVSLFAPCLALSFFYLKEKENSFLLPGDGEVGGGNGGYNGGRFR